jgi:hypothetical protein
MKIVLETIPHDQQRYDTAGDWWFAPDGSLQIRVSEMGDEQYEEMVAVHELIEVLLCKAHGVGQHAVDDFDRAYTGDGEPGDEEGSPYRDEHCFATAVERMLCAAMGRSWAEYDDAVSAL